MSLSKKTRRELLKIGLGVGSLALIEKLGIPLVSPRVARADTSYGAGSGKPTKLLTLYVPGGWSAQHIWCPLSPQEIGTFIPPFNDPYDGQNTSAFFNPAHVKNANGSEDPTDGEGYQYMRIPRVWDEEGLKSKTSWNSNQTYSWSWGCDDPQWRVWERCNAVHGIATGSAGHRAAIVGMLSGIANATFAVPSMHARVAHAMAAAYGDNRPLGSVAIGPRFSLNILPSSGNLPAVASPMHLTSLGSLAPLFSEKYEQGKTDHWFGLNTRNTHEDFNFSGELMPGSIITNEMEEHVLKDIRSKTGSPNDALFEQIHDSYRTVSKQLASDITTTITNSPGLDSCVLDPTTQQCAKDANGKTIPLVPPPYWAENQKHFGLRYWFNYGVEAYAKLALQLLTSDLCSAVHLTFGDAYNDDHGSLDGIWHYKSIIRIHEQIGRMLAFMKMLPGAEGGSLLDETQVIICSEFNRNWPMSGYCDHWPVDSVCFAGGNVHGDRMIGGFETANVPSNAPGLFGKKVNLIDESGDALFRGLQRHDIAYSALHMMGLPNTFLPGGPGRIVGLEDA